MDYNVEALKRPFQKDIIQKRGGGPGGKTLNYVGWQHYVRRMNEAFTETGWSFEILDERIENGFIIVKAQITAGGVTKQQYGGTQIITARDNDKVLQLADDFKIAATDALKKACSLFGVGLDLYSDEEVVPGEHTNQTENKAQGNENGNGTKKMEEILNHMSEKLNLDKNDLAAWVVHRESQGDKEGDIIESFRSAWKADSAGNGTKLENIRKMFTNWQEKRKQS